MKWAVLSMDIEDWYHLDYFIDRECNRRFSFLDGVEVFQNILARWQIPATFFVLGEMARSLSPKLRELHAQGHEIGIHGWDHRRPLTIPPDVFAGDVRRAKETLEDLLAAPMEGYRASCFSLDNERLDLLQKAGYHYDSSRILFQDHPLYGHLDMAGFEQISPHIYRRGDFFEFQVSTIRLARKNIPISGGGYIRFFPWFILRRLVSKYLMNNELYVFYIHPFEMSPRKKPPFPREASWLDGMRFQIGRFRTPQRLEALIRMLKERGFRFLNFSALRNDLLQNLPAVGATAPAAEKIL
jgi:polysaccharide deacetylase family protein (PEP-CTERM system associated)